MIALILAYIATIPVANWLIGHIGTTCVPNGPCLISVAPGVMAPSGVLMIGIALILRDFIQRAYGAWLSLACIAAGTAVSFTLAPVSLALASGLAFALSEFADFAVYTPLWRRRFATAVILSCAAGAVVDSVIFLWIAFGNVDHLAGQIVGKMYAAAIFGIWTVVRRMKVNAADDLS